MTSRDSKENRKIEDSSGEDGTQEKTRSPSSTLTPHVLGNQAQEILDFCSVKSSFDHNPLWKHITIAIIEHMLMRSLLRTSIDVRVRILGRALNWCMLTLGSVPEPREWTQQMVYSFAAGVPSPNTRNTYVSEIKNCFRIAYDLQLIQESPVLRIKPPPRVKKIRDVLTESELHKIWSYLYDPARLPSRMLLKDRVLFELLVSWAPRATELTSLTWDNVDLERLVIEFRQKGGSPRKIGIGPDLENALLAWLETKPESKHLLSYCKERYSNSSIYYTVRKWFKKCGIDRTDYCGTHLFRHTLATRCFLETRDIEKTRQLIGHKRWDSTFTYIHLPMEEVNELSTKLSGSFRKENNVEKKEDE